MSIERLRKKEEFSAVFEKGRRFADANLVLCRYPSDRKATSRVGYSVSKKVGNAVVRNKIKRRLKSLMWELRDEVLGGYDIVWIACPRSSTLTFAQLRKSVTGLLARAKLLMGETDENRG